MEENFQIIKEQVCVENVAQYLLGQPVRGMYRFPDERTPSIKIYPETNSFFDFGRNTGGDCIRLWSHVKGCDNWTALNEIAALYGISTALAETDGKNIAERIKTQKTAQRAREKDEKHKQQLWLKKVECLQEWRKLCQNLLDSGRLPPFCDVRGWCYSEVQITDYKLDILCGIE